MSAWDAFVYVVYFAAIAWYLWQAVKLRRERKRLRTETAKLFAQMDRGLELVKFEANQQLNLYLARIRDWAADPWDPRWDELGGDIFKDLDERFTRKH